MTMTQTQDEGQILPQSSLFGRVETKRVSETISDKIGLLIRNGELKVGERLPQERVLCERLGVSRVALREGLRILEANGLIKIRVGARGGAVVTAPTAGHVGQGISDMVSMSALTPADVTEARRILEIGVVQIACDRATSQDIEELKELCNKGAMARRAGDYTVSVSFDFHLRLAAATHNPAIVLLLQSFQKPIMNSLSEAHHTGVQGVDEHRDLVDAIARRDVAGATTIMAHHLDRTAERLSTQETGAKPS